MKKLTIFFTVLFSYSTTYGSSCDLNYYKNYLDKELEFKLQVLPKNKLNKLLDDFKKIEDSRTKMDALEEAYTFLSGYYDTKNSQLQALVEASKGKVPDDYLKKAARQIEIDSMREIAPLNNRIVNFIADLMEEVGVPVQVKFRQVAGEFQFKYLLLDTSKESTLNSVRTIQRYQKRFGTKQVTFDLLQNTKNGSAGFSQSIEKRIDLGIRGVRNIVLDDLITMVGKHEFHHAAFANMRAKGVASIYHPSYIATGEAAISTVPNHYNRYMSAEELYNWANNSYWASSRIKEISKFSPEDFLNDVIGIDRYMKGTTKIAKQTKEVSENFVKHIEELQANIKAGKGAHLEIYNANYGMAHSFDEAFYVILQKEDGVIMTYYINQDIRPAVNKILEKRFKLIPEYDTKFRLAANNEKFEKEILRRYTKRESEGLEKEIDFILDKISQDQKVLAKVAAAVDEESVALSKKSTEMLKDIEVATKANKEFYKDPIWEKRFEELSKDYRKFGNIVKEKYKGFAGN